MKGGRRFGDRSGSKCAPKARGRPTESGGHIDSDSDGESGKSEKSGRSGADIPLRNAERLEMLAETLPRLEPHIDAASLDAWRSMTFISSRALESILALQAQMETVVKTVGRIERYIKDDIDDEARDAASRASRETATRILGARRASRRQRPASGSSDGDDASGGSGGDGDSGTGGEEGSDDSEASPSESDSEDGSDGGSSSEGDRGGKGGRTRGTDGQGGGKTPGGGVGNAAAEARPHQAGTTRRATRRRASKKARHPLPGSPDRKTILLGTKTRLANAGARIGRERGGEGEGTDGKQSRERSETDRGRNKTTPPRPRMRKSG